MISLAILLALLGSGVLIPPIQSRANAILPNMTVTLSSGNSTYASTVRAGTSIIFRAQVKNTGNVPLQVTANLTVPQNWDVDQDKYSDCPESLAVRSVCTISWYFTPQAAGQVYLRVYIRGFYTDSTGASNRITQSPAFIFNVVSAKGSTVNTGGSGTTTPVPSTSTGTLPNMAVTLNSGNSTYASTVFAGNPLIFRAQVKNTGNVPLQVSANLTVPQGWDVDQDKYSDCPENLAVRSTCTTSWYFTPQATGQVFLRVYVRGFYTNSAGVSNRITQSPAFIFNVKPPKASQ
jgi:acyl-CoA hydrolase